MWGFQPDFRMGLERVALDVFEHIGFGLGARAYLVGFTEDTSQRFPVCFEPEHDALATADLSAVTGRARQLYDNSPESSMFYSSQRHHKRDAPQPP
jgi:hypothetical protein